MKKIAVITVNYKGSKDTVDFVASVIGQKHLGIDFAVNIVIVDNCSPDDSFSNLSEHFKNSCVVKVISNDTNGGYAYGVNCGMKYALASYEPDYILIINNDVIASPDLLSSLIDAIDRSNPSVPVVVTGKMFYYDEPTKIWFAGGYFSKLRCIGMHIGMDKPDCSAYGEPRELSFITGCMWFFRASFVESVGFMPEEYFMYFEDVDYSLRVMKAGGKLLYEPRAIIWHKVGASSVSSRIDYFFPNRNRVYLARKYLSRRERILFYVFFFASRFMKLIQLFFRGKIVNTLKGMKQGFTMRIKVDQK